MSSSAVPRSAPIQRDYLDIPVIEDKLLERSLHDTVEVEQMIPPEFYRAVAEIIHDVHSFGARAGHRGQAGEPRSGEHASGR